jgi:hypothetical protein
MEEDGTSTTIENCITGAAHVYSYLEMPCPPPRLRRRPPFQHSLEIPLRHLGSIGQPLMI